VPQVDDLGPAGLQNPPHDIDRGVVPVDSAAAVMNRILCLALYGCSLLLSERSVMTFLGIQRAGKW